MPILTLKVVFNCTRLDVKIPNQALPLTYFFEQLQVSLNRGGQVSSKISETLCIGALLTESLLVRRWYCIGSNYYLYLGILGNRCKLMSHPARWDTLWWWIGIPARLSSPPHTP